MGKSECPCLGTFRKALGDSVHIFFADALDGLLFLCLWIDPREESGIAVSALFSHLILKAAQRVMDGFALARHVRGPFAEERDPHRRAVAAVRAGVHRGIR